MTISVISSVAFVCLFVALLVCLFPSYRSQLNSNLHRTLQGRRKNWL